MKDYRKILDNIHIALGRNPHNDDDESIPEVIMELRQVAIQRSEQLDDAILAVQKLRDKVADLERTLREEKTKLQATHQPH